MQGDTVDQHLSRIQTLWTLVRLAHAEPGDAARNAQQQLLDRYGGSIRRYLRGVTRDADTADDLFQEFACRLLSGDLHGADPTRGRFRNYVKGVLFHLVADFHRRRKRNPVALGENVPEPAIDPQTLSDLDRDFVISWRDEVLARCWQALEQTEQKTGKPFYTVLRFRAEHPKLASGKLAEQLGTRLGRALTAAGIRQTLHRARDRFADLVIEEVAQSLEAPTAEQLTDELTVLDLIEYCRPALERKMKPEGKHDAGTDAS